METETSKRRRAHSRPPNTTLLEFWQRPPQGRTGRCMEVLAEASSSRRGDVFPRRPSQSPERSSGGFGNQGSVPVLWCRGSELQCLFFGKGRLFLRNSQLRRAGCSVLQQGLPCRVHL